jgi:hypothetical protein
MASGKLVTVVGATGAQGGAVVRSLIETGKYKVMKLLEKNMIFFIFSKDSWINTRFNK